MFNTILQMSTSYANLICRHQNLHVQKPWILKNSRVYSILEYWLPCGRIPQCHIFIRSHLMGTFLVRKVPTELLHLCPNSGFRRECGWIFVVYGSASCHRLGYVYVYGSIPNRNYDYCGRLRGPNIRIFCPIQQHTVVYVDRQQQNRLRREIWLLFWFCFEFVLRFEKSVFYATRDQEDLALKRLGRSNEIRIKDCSG